MKVRFVLESPDEMEATVKITMTVREWCLLRDQLPQAWPSSRLSPAILNVIAEARKVFYADEKDASQ